MATFKNTGYGSLLEKKAKQEIKAPVYSTTPPPPPPTAKITFTEAETMLATGNASVSVLERVRKDFPDFAKWEIAKNQLEAMIIPEEARGSDGPLGIVEIVNKIAQLAQKVTDENIRKITVLQQWVKSAGGSTVTTCMKTVQTLEDRADLKAAFKILSLCNRYDRALHPDLIEQMQTMLAAAEAAEADAAKEAAAKKQAEEEAEKAAANAANPAGSNPVTILVNGLPWDGKPIKMAPQLILAVSTEKAATTSWTGPAGFKAVTKLVTIPRKGTYTVSCLGITKKIKVIE